MAHDTMMNGYSIYEALHERVTRSEEGLKAVQASTAEVKATLSKLLWLLIGTLLSAVGSLLAALFSVFALFNKHG